VINIRLFVAQSPSIGVSVDWSRTIGIFNMRYFEVGKKGGKLYSHILRPYSRIAVNQSSSNWS
jgi:hypothetical protein